MCGPPQLYLLVHKPQETVAINIINHIGDMFTNFGHLPIYAMEQVLTTDGSELLPASDRKKSPMSSARIEASDRAEHHQRSLGTCWRRCADSLWAS